jgi:hypothetical protein
VKLERQAGPPSRAVIQATAIAVTATIYVWFWLVTSHRVFEGPSFAAFAQVFRTGCGDFEHFYNAAIAMRLGQDIYASGVHGYIYPPLIAFLFMPLTFVSVQTAALIMLAANMSLALWCTWEASREAGRRLGRTLSTHDLVMIVALTTLLAAPRLRSELQMWQTNILLIAGLLLTLKHLDSRPWLAGLMLGLVINIKYLPVLFIPYLLLRRRTAAAAWSVVGVIGFALLPAIQTGFEANLRNWAVASAGLARLFGFAAPSSQAANIDPITAGHSLSVTSSLARVLGPQAGTFWPLAGAAVAAALSLALIAALYRRHGQPLVAWPAAAGQAVQPFRGLIQRDWAALVMLALAFSPQTNPRHASLLLLVLAPLSVMICLPRGGTDRRTAIAGASILFVAFANPTNVPALASFGSWWNRVGIQGWGMLAALPFLYLGARD